MSTYIREEIGKMRGVIRLTKRDHNTDRDPRRFLEVKWLEVHHQVCSARTSNDSFGSTEEKKTGPRGASSYC